MNHESIPQFRVSLRVCHWPQPEDHLLHIALSVKQTLGLIYIYVLKEWNKMAQACNVYIFYQSHFPSELKFNSHELKRIYVYIYISFLKYIYQEKITTKSNMLHVRRHFPRFPRKNAFKISPLPSPKNKLPPLSPDCRHGLPLDKRGLFLHRPAGGRWLKSSWKIVIQGWKNPCNKCIMFYTTHFC